MLDLIKMDIHRLFKTRAVILGLILSAALSAISISVIAGINLLVPLLDGDSVFMLSMMVPQLSWSESVSLFEIIFTGLSILSLLVLCVLAAVYISEEQLSGYVKNIAGQVKDKSMMILSKFVTLAILTLCVIFVYCLGAILPGILFFHGSMTLDMAEIFFPALFVKYLLYLAVATIILFLCTIAKSKSLALAIGVIFGTGVTGIVYSVCDLILQFILNIDISISALVPDGVISSIGLTSDAAGLVKGALVAICYILLFILFSSLLMKKRDTR